MTQRHKLQLVYSAPMTRAPCSRPFARSARPLENPWPSSLTLKLASLRRAKPLAAKLVEQEFEVIVDRLLENVSKAQ